MSVDIFKRLLVLLVILGAVAYLLNRGGPSGGVSAPGEVRPGDTVFPGLDVNRIASFRLVSNQGTVTLERSDTGWVVKNLYDYPARFDVIVRFLRRFDDLVVGQVVRDGGSALGEFGLDPEGSHSDWHSVELRLDGGDEPLVLSLGLIKQPRTDLAMGMAFPQGRYMNVADGPVLLVNELFADISAQPMDWVDTTLFELPAETIQSVTVALADQPPYTIVRDAGASFALQDQAPDEAVDPSTAVALFQSLQLLKFVDVIDPALPDADAGMEAVDQAVVTTTDGVVYTIRAGRSDGAPGATRPIGVTVTDGSTGGTAAETVANEQARLELWRFAVPYLAPAALFTPRALVAPPGGVPPPLPASVVDPD